MPSKTVQPLEMVEEQLLRVEKVSVAESGTLSMNCRQELSGSILPFIERGTAGLVRPERGLQVRSRVLEILILLPLVLHQSLKTFDSFLLPIKVTNLISLEVHDKSNVGHTGAREGIIRNTIFSQL